MTYDPKRDPHVIGSFDAEQLRAAFRGDEVSTFAEQMRALRGDFGQCHHCLRMITAAEDKRSLHAHAYHLACFPKGHCAGCDRHITEGDSWSEIAMSPTPPRTRLVHNDARCIDSAYSRVQLVPPDVRDARANTRRNIIKGCVVNAESYDYHVGIVTTHRDLEGVWQQVMSHAVQHALYMASNQRGKMRTARFHHMNRAAVSVIEHHRDSGFGMGLDSLLLLRGIPYTDTDALYRYAQQYRVSPDLIELESNAMNGDGALFSASEPPTLKPLFWPKGTIGKRARYGDDRSGNSAVRAPDKQEDPAEAVRGTAEGDGPVVGGAGGAVATSEERGCSNDDDEQRPDRQTLR